VARPKRCEADALVLDALMIVDQTYLFKGVFDILFVEKLLVACWYAADFDEILQHAVIYRFGWMSHVDLPCKFCLLGEVWQTCTMINMKMSDQHKLNIPWTNRIKIR